MIAASRAWSPPVLLAVGLVLAGCAGSPGPTTGMHKSRYQVGRPSYQVAPYQINGVWYTPKVDYAYDETGTASWYGPGFDRQPTSNGELYDMNQLSAAHKTLPLPSIVEVTNLQNGRAVRLRVNDRGPFVGDRLIDVSRRAAQLLGFEGVGTTTARVRVLKEESIQVAEAAMRGEFGPTAGATAVAQAAPVAATRVAAAAPRRQPAPVMHVAEAVPPSLRATQVIGAPSPNAGSGLPAAGPPSLRAQEVIAGPTPAAAPAPVMTAMPQQPPEPAVSAPRRWPSLIAEARADTLRAPAAFAAKHSGRIFIQAGAFAVPENAQRVRARIAALGSVEVVPSSSRGVPLYLVRLGPVTSEAQAQRLLSRVVDSGYPGARVIGE